MKFFCCLIFVATNQFLFADGALYEMAPRGVVSRSISFENPTGEPGQGGTAEGDTGVGRKGSPKKILMPGQEIQLCDIQGRGVIRHIWMTLDATRPAVWKGIVIEAYWDGQDHPSISSPVGAFFGMFGEGPVAYQNAVHSLNSKGGMDIWLPMPFMSSARIVLRNEGTQGSAIFYQIDYTLGDQLHGNVGRLHALYRRENPTTLREDFAIMPERKGKGRFIGAVCELNAQGDSFWPGEGEFKFYMDGDTQFPTICGTGMEDWIGQSWGFQTESFWYGGCPINSDEQRRYVFYRWHIQDPIWWRESGRATIQQLGHNGKLFERQDDMQSCAFWYEPIPSDPLPLIPSFQERMADPWKWGQQGDKIKGPVPGLNQ